MQDNLINQETLNTIIQTLFGSYEKFAMSLIEKRRQNEQEKRNLQSKLEKAKIDKEANDKALESFHGRRIGRKYYSSHTNTLVDRKPLTFSSFQQEKPSGSLKSYLEKDTELNRIKNLYSERIDYLLEEKVVMDNVLGHYHGKKIDGEYYDSVTNSLCGEKPERFIDDTAGDQINDFAEYLSLKKEELNRLAGRELIVEEELFSASESTGENLQEISFRSYKDQVFHLIQRDYIPAESKGKVKSVFNENSFKNKLRSAFDEGLSADSFVDKLAAESLWKKVVRKGGLGI